MYSTFQNQGFVILGVSLDRSDPKVIGEFVKKHGVTFPIGLDTQSEAAMKYGVRGTPTSFLISAEGKVLGGAPGPRQWDNEAATGLVKHLLNGAQ